MDCLFCKIIAGTIPGKILFRDERVIAFADINPQAPFHALVVPVSHLASASELSAQHGPLLIRVFELAKQLVDEAGFGGPRHGYRVVTNTGVDAGQSVHHLHFHVLAGRPLHWPPG